MALRYAELTPAALEEAWKRRPLAVMSFGALEWHGAHLPLGLDGIVAESFAEKLADKLDGVLLPCSWMAMTTLPHPHSLQIRTEAFRAMLDDTLACLYMGGARVVCLITGHYAQGQQVELYEAALRAMDGCRGYRVLTATPLEPLNDPDLLDHAAHWETAQLMALRPELVRLEELPPTEVSPRRTAVLGAHPGKATAQEGNDVLSRALSTWAEWTEALLASEDTAFLRDFYAKRLSDYAAYIRTYKQESWEQAILDWWLTKS